MTDSLFDLTNRNCRGHRRGFRAGAGDCASVLPSAASIWSSRTSTIKGLPEPSSRFNALGRRAVAVHCDVSDAAQVAQLFETVDQTFEHVDILVNAPFYFDRVTPETLTLEQWNRALAVSLTGYFLCAQEAGRRMIASGRGGNIINIGSIAGQTSLGRGNFVYGVAKSGIHQMTRELATEWAKHKIRVTPSCRCRCARRA